MSDSPGLVDFVIGLVDSDHHLPDGQVKFFWDLKLQNYCKTYFFNFQILIHLREPKAVFQAGSHKGKSFEKSIALHFMPDISIIREIFPL